MNLNADISFFPSQVQEFLLRRQDFGFENANYAAAFFAALIALAWLPCFMRPSCRLSCTISWLVFLGAGFCLIATGSRGGYIAGFLGMLPVIYFAVLRYYRSLTFWVLCLLSIGLLSASIAQTSSPRRLTRMLGDDSVGNRLVIYRSAPSMLKAAPFGWGFGNSGETYTNWFQDTSEQNRYKHLVSTHLSWAVEGGWPFVIPYTFLWLSLLTFTFPMGKSICLAPLWGAFCATFVAAWFSHTGSHWWTWIPSILGLLSLLAFASVKLYKNPGNFAVSAQYHWLKKRLRLLCVTFAVLNASLILATSCSSPPHGLYFTVGKAVVLQGKASNKTQVLYVHKDESQVLGKYPGIAIRNAMRNATGEGTAHNVIVLRGAFSVNEEPSRIVLFGHVPNVVLEALPDKVPVDWFNPRQFDSSMLHFFHAPVHVHWGRLRRDAQATELRKLRKNRMDSEWIDLPSSGLFVGRENFIFNLTD